jgi:Fe2+ transport system protein FeoA
LTVDLQVKFVYDLGLFRQGNKTMTKINLAEAPADVELEVLELKTGMVARQRLLAMGVHAGDRVRKYPHSGHGAVLIANITMNSSKVAIGRGLADRIMVGYEET